MKEARWVGAHSLAADMSLLSYARCRRIGTTWSYPSPSAGIDPTADAITGYKLTPSDIRVILNQKDTALGHPESFA